MRPFLLRHRDAFAFLALIFLIFFRRVPLEGKMLFPAGFLQDRLPGGKPPDRPAIQKEITFGDVEQEVVPWQYFLSDELHAGRFPLWLPYAGGGAPFLAGNSSSSAFPGTLLAAAFPKPAQLTVVAFIKLAIAALGMALLLGRWGLSPPARALAAATFTFSWIMVWGLCWPFTTALATFPWIILALERLREKPGLTETVWVGLAVGLAFLSGNAESTAQLLAAAAIFLVLRLCWTLPRQELIRRSFPVLALALAGVALGTVIAGIQILPTLELLPRSLVWGARAGYGLWSLPRNVAALWVAPQAWGDPTWRTPDGKPAWIPTNANYWQCASGYVGAGTLALTVAAFDRRRLAVVGPLALLCAIFLAVGYGIGLNEIFGRIPLLDKAPNFRGIYVSAFCFCALAGIGLDALVEQPARRFWVAVAAGVIAVLSVLTAFEIPGPLTPGARVGTPILGVLATGGLAMLLGYVEVPFRRHFLWAFALVASLEVLAVFDDLNPWSSPLDIYPPVTQMKAGAETEGFFAAWAGILPPETSAAYRVRDIRSYDPLLTTRWRHFFDLLDPTTTGEGQTMILRNPRPEWMRVAGINRYLMLGSPNAGLGWIPSGPPVQSLQPATLHGSHFEQDLTCETGNALQLQVYFPGKAQVAVHLFGPDGEIPVAAAPNLGNFVLVEMGSPVRCPAKITLSLTSPSPIDAQGAAPSEGWSRARVDGAEAPGLLVATAWSIPLPVKRVKWDFPTVTLEDDPIRPLAWLSERALPASKDDLGKEAEAKMVELAPSPDRWVVLEGGNEQQPLALDTGSEGAHTTRPSPGEIDVSVTTKSPRWLVVQETGDPGWKATVDGRAIPLVAANLVFQAVPVPAGTHQVVLRYRPASVIWGALLSAAGLALCGLVFVRKRKVEPPTA